MTHDDGDGSNVSIVEKALKGKHEGYTFSYLTKSDTEAVKSISGIMMMFRFFFQKPYELSRAEIILLDNIFLPYAFMKRKKSTKIIQLWHGTGTIKKFGQDVNQGKLGELELRANSNITHLIVNSQEMKKLYARIFGVNESVVYPIGLPRTDVFIHKMKKIEQIEKNIDKEQIYVKYKIPKDKKLILYAPTFRDQEAQNYKLLELMNELSNKLGQEYYLGLRLHPFIADAFRQEQLEAGVYQFSYEKNLNALLMAADILITDYSSIIFEYCITKRPMIFYAYDYNKFTTEDRGFYYDYESFVPGPMAYRCEEVAAIIREKKFETYKIEKFVQHHYDGVDGRNTERLIELMK